MQEIQQDLKKASLAYSQVFKPDPSKPNVIRVEGVSRRKPDAVDSLLGANKYANEYDIANGYQQHLDSHHEAAVRKRSRKRTVEEAIETIRDRVDALGVSEPLIQEYGLGANQILVELPGISDLDQVKSIIQSTARLEIHAVTAAHFQLGRGLAKRQRGASAER